MHAVQNAHIADNHPCLVIVWHYVNQKGQLVAGPIGRLRVIKHQVSNIDFYCQQD